MNDSEPTDLGEVLFDLRAHLAWQAEAGGDVLLGDRAALAEARAAAVRARPEAPARAGGSPAAQRQAPGRAPTVAAAPELQRARPLARPAEAARPAPAVAASGAPAPAPKSIFDLPKVQPVPEAERRTLDEIRRELGDCTRCRLCKERRNIVFGVGNPRADLVFVGEGPGAEEDAQGIPFVGAAGQLLTKMIEAMGFGRDDVYICNVVKCRPPGNRNPEADEIQACEPFLRAQLGAIQPKVIVALGKFAAQTLLRDSTSISRLRGNWREYAGVPLMPTFHPAYLLRSPEQKKHVWADLQQVMKVFGKEPARKSG